MSRPDTTITADFEEKTTKCWKTLEGCIDLLSAFLVRLSEEMEKGFDFCLLKP